MADPLRAAESALISAEILVHANLSRIKSDLGTDKSTRDENLRVNIIR